LGITQASRSFLSVAHEAGNLNDLRAVSGKVDF